MNIEIIDFEPKYREDFKNLKVFGVDKYSNMTKNELFSYLTKEMKNNFNKDFRINHMNEEMKKSTLRWINRGLYLAKAIDKVLLDNR